MVHVFFYLNLEKNGIRNSELFCLCDDIQNRTQAAKIDGNTSSVIQ